MRAPITHGMPNSRETIAAWHVMPPSSVTTATAFFIAGKNSGRVCAATSTSPLRIEPSSANVFTTRALPTTEPAHAQVPSNSMQSTCSLPAKNSRRLRNAASPDSMKSPSTVYSQYHAFLRASSSRRKAASSNNPAATSRGNASFTSAASNPFNPASRAATSSITTTERNAAVLRSSCQNANSPANKASSEILRSASLASAASRSPSNSLRR